MITLTAPDASEQLAHAIEVVIRDMPHRAAEQQIRDTKQPKARHGGGGESA